MEFYVRRGKENDVRRLFEQALGFLNQDVDFCWRYYSWEKEIQGKKKILNIMLAIISKDNNSSKFSKIMICVSMQLVKIALESEGYESALVLFDRILTCESLSGLNQIGELKNRVSLNQSYMYRMLSIDHFIKLWLLMWHFRYFKTIPLEAFESYPYDYLVKDDYFLIRWNSNCDTCPKSVKSFLLKSIRHLSKLIVDDSTDLNYSQTVLIKNMFQFHNLVLGHFENAFHDFIDALLIKFNSNPELLRIKGFLNVFSWILLMIESADT